jgi:hypothetical protein
LKEGKLIDCDSKSFPSLNCCSAGAQTSEQSELLEPLKFKEKPVILSCATNASRGAKDKTKVLPTSEKQNKIKVLPGSNVPSFPSHLQNALVTRQDWIILNPNRSSGFLLEKMFRFLRHLSFIPYIAAYYY